MYDLASLNEAQRKAAIHGDGPLLVLAGPGSGKTFTITNRISYLIWHYRIPPDQILVITFTKDAALSMQQRFLRQEQQPQGHCQQDTLPVHFGTFHAVFYHIIKQSCGIKQQILTESEKRKLIIPGIEQIKKEQQIPYGESYEEAVSLLAAISLFKNTDEKERASKLLSVPWRDHFDFFLNYYEQHRKAAGKIDFDDMIYYCLELLKNDQMLLSRWQKQFRYILIDEFQDINPIQYQMVRLLAPPPCNLFVVGDDDQSIYGFRGSEPALMRSFLKDYPDAGKILLDTNYRSHALIVEKSLKVIGQNKDRFPKELKAHADAKGKVLLKAFTEKEEQYHYLIEELRTKSEKTDGGNSAVLFRTNGEMQGFAARLKKAGISFYMKEKNNCIYDHFIVRDMNAYLRLAEGECDRRTFLGIMNKPSRYISREALNSERVSLQDMKKYYQQNHSIKGRFEIMERIDRLERELKQLKSMKPFLGISYIRKGIGYERYLRSKAGGNQDKLQEWSDILDFLKEDIQSFQSIGEWFAYQEQYRKEWTQTSSPAKAGEEGIHLMTAHASKGLEFSKVYLPDVNEGNYPHGRLPEPVIVEEECRLLYVAMTRAKEALELLFITGTKERPKLPSRFLNPLLRN